jgi:magnesium transporter
VDETVSEAVDRLRRETPAEAITYFYAVDLNGRLRGVVPVRNLLLCPPDRRVGEVMVRRVVTLPVEATVADAYEAFILYKLLALPVVDAEGRLLGVVDVQFYTYEMEELHRAEARDELFQRIGVHVAGVEQRSPLRAFRQRAPWLSVNLIGGVACALLAGLFEGTLNGAVALAFFIPVVLNMAESVSSQSVSLAL